MNGGERADADRSRGFSGLQVAGIALLCVLASALLTAWAVRVYIYPSEKARSMPNSRAWRARADSKGKPRIARAMRLG